MKTTARRVALTKEHVPDEALTEAIRGFRETIENSMDIVLGRSKVMLDARFSEIRTKETNVSNFLAELMTRATGANISILNAGTIRADRFVEPGLLTMRDMCDLLVRYSYDLFTCYYLYSQNLPILSSSQYASLLQPMAGKPFPFCHVRCLPISKHSKAYFLLSLRHR